MRRALYKSKCAYDRRWLYWSLGSFVVKAHLTPNHRKVHELAIVYDRVYRLSNCPVDFRIFRAGKLQMVYHSNGFCAGADDVPTTF